MPWTAQIQRLTPTSQGFEVSVVITDGVSQKFVESFQCDEKLTTLRNQARARTVVVDVIHTKPEYAVGDMLDLALDPVVVPVPLPDPVPPTPEEVARGTFFMALARYEATLRFVSAGVIAADDPALAAQLKGLQAAFAPAYLP